MNPVEQLPKRKSKTVIGLMSGTSMDGIDSAIVEIKGSGIKSKIKPLGFLCKKYSHKLKKRLLEINDRTAGKEISELNYLVAEEFANAAKMCAKKFISDISNVDLIGSHGQTIYHNPPSRKNGIPATLQIGDIDVIAEKTGVSTAGDFRQRDMAAGGEGAPIMPYVDYLLFSKQSHGPVLTQNIGGIANVTVVTSRPDDMIAFDTGPGNMIMDGIVRLNSDGKNLFDKNGVIARRGKIDEKLFQKLLLNDYYRQKPPKSTGAEKFGSKAAEGLYKLIKSKKIKFEDMMRTLLELTVESIAQAYENFIFPRHTIKKVILSGGGAKNIFMVSELRKRLAGIEIISSQEFGIPVEAKEAIGMAVLANELVSGNKTNVPSCTGALRNVPLGKISYSF
jgi:anhydro-N-acetylmuramic acid kinase